MGFSVDLNVGMLSLTFDETVDGKSINPDEVVLRDNQNPELSLTNFTLTGAIGENAVEWVKNQNQRTYPHTDSDVISIYFTKHDIDEIKRLNLCTESNDCYLVHTEYFAYDMQEIMIERCS